MSLSFITRTAYQWMKDCAPIPVGDPECAPTH